jgi:hypothetical protein
MTHPRTFTFAAVSFFVLLIAGYGGAQTVRCTTWNLEWFPNGSAHETSAEQQNQRIKEAADVLRPIDPDILLLQEVRDYEACARLGEAIAPGIRESLSDHRKARAVNSSASLDGSEASLDSIVISRFSFPCKCE